MNAGNGLMGGAARAIHAWADKTVDRLSCAVLGEPRDATYEPLYQTETVIVREKERAGPWLIRLFVSGTTTGDDVDWYCPRRLAAGLRPGDEVILAGRAEIRETDVRRVVTERPRRAIRN